MRRLFQLSALLLTAACGIGTEPAPALSVLASVERAKVQVGERVVVDVSVGNPTSQPARIPGGPFAALEVRDDSKRVVAFGRYEVLPAIAHPPQQLAPGDVAADQAPWAGELAGSTERAVAGTYWVRAAVPVHGPGGSFGYRYSSPIKIVLTP